MLNAFRHPKPTAVSVLLKDCKRQNPEEIRSGLNPHGLDPGMSQNILWLSLYIKMPLVQLHAEPCFLTSSSVTELVPQSVLAFLARAFCTQCSFLALPWPWACFLPPTKLIHSSCYPRRTPLTSHTYVIPSARGGSSVAAEQGQTQPVARRR